MLADLILAVTDSVMLIGMAVSALTLLYLPAIRDVIFPNKKIFVDVLSLWKPQAITPLTPEMLKAVSLFIFARSLVFLGILLTMTVVWATYKLSKDINGFLGF